MENLSNKTDEISLILANASEEDFENFANLGCFKLFRMPIIDLAEKLKNTSKSLSREMLVGFAEIGVAIVMSEESKS